ncbi:MAG: M1 family metallopeptidase [Gammaproteobacteria bacterium]|nr:M1 family metallopeptidase [Gammaproteobacteria bacterium]NND46546.1 M1 family metallopeptidase [Woeseiaceae bacterium]
MREKLALTVVVAVFLCACSEKARQVDAYDPARDYFSFANTEQFVTTRLALDLLVDFEARELRGSATLFMQRLDPDAMDIVLDTRDLDIAGAHVLLADDVATAADYRFGDSDNIRGTPLIVHLPEAAAGATEFRLQLQYKTSPESTALQWLPPELTAGGKHPLMFSQSQAIHARSWVPLQDTPAVRITYEAEIRTPPDLLAVMSANNDPLTPRDGEYQFEMPQPIPSYLLAVAVGNIFFAPLGEQAGVYAEPELLDASVFEFADTQEMLDQAEILFGPYEWGRYDLLVLPPSFPYGGMENPRLSFITPSLLAGDRSLVSVIAHELAHSWSGNLVTNATWRDGWLNEGMTSYLESRLMEVIYDKARVDEERVLSYQELLLDLETVPLNMQALAPRLDVGDPDDFQGTIHYSKGQLFLQFLENAFGRDAFDRFLFTYFDTFAFQTITTERFLDYLDENLLQDDSSTVSRANAEEWLYQPGLPDDAPVPTSQTLDDAKALAAAWAEGKIDITEIPIANWSPQATVHFINSLPAELDSDQLTTLDEGLGFSDTRNAEIGRTWFIQVAKRRYTPAYEKLERHLNRFGRGRLIAPVYTALAQNGTDLELARSMFATTRGAYHPLTEASIARVLDAEGIGSK